MEKLYREFFNEKVEALCRNAKYNGWKKMEIEGAINSSWTLRKTTILREEVTSLKGRIDKINETESVSNPPKMETVAKNVERMMVARSAIDSGNKEIQRFNEEIDVCVRREYRLQLLKSKKEKETNIDKMVTELKKAQDSLRKSRKMQN